MKDACFAQTSLALFTPEDSNLNSVFAGNQFYSTLSVTLVRGLREFIDYFLDHYELCECLVWCCSRELLSKGFRVESGLTSLTTRWHAMSGRALSRIAQRADAIDWVWLPGYLDCNYAIYRGSRK